MTGGGGEHGAAVLLDHHDRLGRADLVELVEPLEHDGAKVVDVDGAHQQDHVEGAEGEGQVLDAGQLEHGVAGAVPPLLVDIDEHQGGDAEADGGGVDGGAEPGDDAVGAQSVDPAVGRRAGDPGPGCQLVDREPPVGDEQLDEASVDGVERGV